MSDAATLEARAQVRKERVHTTMLIELLVLLVFLAMTFAFISRDELSTSALQAKVNVLEKQVGELRIRVRALERENRELELANRTLAERLRRWMDQPKDRLPADDTSLAIPKEQFERLTGRLANSEAMVDERQQENAKLRRDLAVARGGGTDLPNCPVTTGFLLSIDLEGDGTFTVRPAWSAGASDLALGVPGVRELTTRRSMSAAAFRSAASQAQAWGKQQTTPCGFRVSVREKHGNLTRYKSQLRAVESAFYVRRN
jgi:hypothetical protein